MTRVDASVRMRRWKNGIDQRRLPYVLLAAASGLVVATDLDGPWRDLLTTLALAVLTAGWMWWMVTRHPQWQHRQTLMIGYIAGLLLLMAVLVWRNPLYAFFVWSGYLHVMYALRSPVRVLTGSAVVAVLTAVAQTGGVEAVRDPGNLPVFVMLAALNVGISCAMMYVAWTNDARAIRRQQTIAELAEANGRLAAAMAENAELHGLLLVQAREAGVLDERQRMAGEIHDVLAQGLTGIVTQLQAAELAADRPADRGRHLSAAIRLARESLTEARRSVRALTPRPLAVAGLPEALRDITRTWSTTGEVPAQVIVTGEAHPLPPEVEGTLLRTAQEALANVARHAGARRVALTLSYMGDMVTLDVRDDGAGFDVGAVPTGRPDGGYGLAAMRERVRRVGGTVEVESEPGGGTAVSACVPTARPVAVGSAGMPLVGRDSVPSAGCDGAAA